jgi:pyruvyltransferase
MINAYWCESTNFGDALTPWLIQKITGELPTYTHWATPSIEPVYMIMGSMLDELHPNAVVWGCGMAWRKDIVRQPKEIRAVRGPISVMRARECGVVCPDVYGDPALLLPKFYTPKITKQHRVGIIPHYDEYDVVSSRFNGFVINMKAPIEKVIDEICSCESIISSSLHGLVVAQAYNIPNRWVEFTTNHIIGDRTKYLDFLMSIKSPVTTPIDLTNSNDFDFPIIPHESRLDLQKLTDACPWKLNAH